MKEINRKIGLLISLYFAFCIHVTRSTSSCGKQVSDYLICIDKLGLSDEAKGTNSPTFDEFQKKISSCFTSNGCKDVKLESEESISKRHGLPDDAISASQHLEDCKSKTQLKARSSVEKCVATSMPNFTFPPAPAQRQPGVGLPITLSWAVEVFIQLRSKDTCPNSDKVPTAEKCLHDVFQETVSTKSPNPFDNFITAESRINTFCKANCSSKIDTATCKHQPEDGLKTICDCIASDLKKNFDRYDSDLASCLGNDVKVSGYIKNNTVNEVLDDIRTQLCQRVPDNPCNRGSFVDLLKASKAKAPKMRR